MTTVYEHPSRRYLQYPAFLVDVIGQYREVEDIVTDLAPDYQAMPEEQRPTLYAALERSLEVPISVSKAALEWTRVAAVPACYVCGEHAVQWHTRPLGNRQVEQWRCRAHIIYAAPVGVVAPR